MKLNFLLAAALATCAMAASSTTETSTKYVLISPI